MRRGVVAAALLALFLAACATVKPPPRPAPPPPVPAAPPTSALDVLPGWRQDDHAAAFAAFVAACGVAQDPAMAAACHRARARPGLDHDQARAFFEANFQPLPAGAPGIMTGYFAPEYEARTRPGGAFSAALRGKPADLAPGRPYAERAVIEASAPQRALAWMRPEELFFLQVQGSGVLTFPDGRRMKASVAATNGRPFLAIANPMRERGLLGAQDTSADTIRKWLAAHRGPEADAVMRLNPRYVFFHLAPDDGRPPLGSARVALPAGRAVAVDPAQHAFGDLLWLDATKPSLAGAVPVYRRLALALDTGGAIKGAARADLYLGQGAAAGEEAGRVRHVLQLYRLAPRPEPQAP